MRVLGWMHVGHERWGCHHVTWKQRNYWLELYHQNDHSNLVLDETPGGSSRFDCFPSTTVCSFHLDTSEWWINSSFCGMKVSKNVQTMGCFSSPQMSMHVQGGNSWAPCFAIAHLQQLHFPWNLPPMSIMEMLTDPSSYSSLSKGCSNKVYVSGWMYTINCYSKPRPRHFLP